MTSRFTALSFLSTALIAGALCISSGTSAQATRDRVTASPTPTPAASPTTTPAIQTLTDLQAKIASRLMSPEARRARVGVKVMSLNSGKVIFESDAEKYFVPASNMKSFTVAAALESLGPDFKFVTSVYATAMPDASGTIKGDLRILGRGDVSISTLFNNGDYYKGLDNLADKIVAAGVKGVEGHLIADESYFRGNPVPLTWEWDDLQWDDGAEVSAFPINNNAVDLTVKGGARGGPCIVTILPTNTLYQITNTCTTAGSKRNLTVKKALEKNSVAISGTMPAGDTFTGYITVSHPADLFISLLKDRLALKSVIVTGGARSISSPPQVPATEIARLESPPLREIAAKTMKPSQNMFTEVILWTLGEEISRKKGASGDSHQLGLGVLRNWLTTAGITSDSVIPYDGSGLSRHNLVTPAANVQLYTYMAKKSVHSQAWRESLTIGGIDGTLRNRFKGTSAAGNMRGKTGTLDQVSALTGYVTTAAGEQLVVSVMVNAMPITAQRIALIDGIVVQLANFNGRIDQ